MMRNPTTPRLSFARPYTGRRLPLGGGCRILTTQINERMHRANGGTRSDDPSRPNREDH